MRYIQTYTDLMTDNIFEGVMGHNFFCTVVVPACENIKFTRSTLQFYQERVKATLKPKNLYTNNVNLGGQKNLGFADRYYAEKIRDRAKE